MPLNITPGNITNITNISNITNGTNTTSDEDDTWTSLHWSVDLVVLCVISVYAMAAVDFGVLRSTKLRTCSGWVEQK